MKTKQVLLFTLTFGLFPTALLSTTKAHADVRVPGFVETCTSQKFTSPSCVICSAYYATHGRCEALATWKYMQICRTAGASVWTEIWCPLGTATLPADVQSHVGDSHAQLRSAQMPSPTATTDHPPAPPSSSTDSPPSPSTSESVSTHTTAPVGTSTEPQPQSSGSSNVPSAAPKGGCASCAVTGESVRDGLVGVLLAVFGVGLLLRKNKPSKPKKDL